MGLMKKSFLFVWAVLFFAGLGREAYSQAKPARNSPFVRVWEGQMAEGVDGQSFLNFLTQVLIPTTVTANSDSLRAYIPIVLDPSAPIPRDASIDEVPFHEAALVVHRNETAYRLARAANPWYGPAHFLYGGGFDSSSFSASPEEFSGEVDIATSQDPVAYHFGNKRVDWQAGRVLASVILRRKGQTNGAYLKAVLKYMEEMSPATKTLVDAGYFRVGTDHVTIWLHLRKWVRRSSLEAILGELSATHAQSLVFGYFDQYSEPAAHGRMRVEVGRVYNVMFKRPYRGPLVDPCALRRLARSR
ncbi:MAG: hypothetical protein COV44_01800 [Deltaproteobacteria bacterium CG11_big_fil_rev_8_21_14_0_20_45_16]|nr:MAG: hypothetical protein COV44_01800 [Deltaproteobacteria bacterium CG11_big_fil_rev_8_21_14_0_20_45_16]